MTEREGPGLPAPRGTSRRTAARAVLLAVIVGSAWPSQPAVGAGPAVRLTAGEFFFTPRDIGAVPGVVTFEIKNVGAIEHNFVVEGAGAKHIADIAIIEPGQTLATTATVSPGAYTIYCSLPGHRDAGMVATLSVR